MMIIKKDQSNYQGRTQRANQAKPTYEMKAKMKAQTIQNEGPHRPDMARLVAKERLVELLVV